MCVCVSMRVCAFVCVWSSTCLAWRSTSMSAPLFGSYSGYDGQGVDTKNPSVPGWVPGFQFDFRCFSALFPTRVSLSTSRVVSAGIKIEPSSRGGVIAFLNASMCPSKKQLESATCRKPF